MKKFDSINVIPFIDIMLVLLAIVLATTSFINQGKIEVNLPQSENNHQRQSKDNITLITITKTGQFFYQSQSITIAELDKALGKLPPTHPITIKIDANTAFQQFVSISDLLTKHQLKKVAVITQKSLSKPERP